MVQAITVVKAKKNSAAATNIEPKPGSACSIAALREAGARGDVGEAGEDVWPSAPVTL